MRAKNCREPEGPLLLRVKHLCWGCIVLAVVLAGPCEAQIRRVQNFRENGSYGDWSRESGIVFKRDGEIWLAGAGPARDVCVTCGNSGVVARRNTAPVWFPGGQRFLFRSGDGRVLIGDSFGYNTLGQITLGQITLGQIVRVPGVDSKAADFRFSRDGKMLAWTQRSQPLEAFLADLSAGNMEGVHRLELPKDLVFEAVDDFLPGGRELLVTASRHGADARLTEIYACTVSGRVRCRGVTNKPGEHNDYGRLTTSGRRLLFASSDVGWAANDPVGFLSDYWLLDLEGTGGVKRMTWFNEPANPNYIDKGVRAETACWGPDGKWLLATLILDARTHHTRLVKIEFPEVE